MCFVQVSRDYGGRVATCKSAQHFGANSACCAIVKDLWGTMPNTVDVEHRNTLAWRIKGDAEMRAEVQPAAFVVPVCCPKLYISKPLLKDRVAATVVEGSNSSIVSVYPLHIVEQADRTRCVLQRKCTLWGPWRAQQLLIFGEVGTEPITGEEYGLFPVDDANFVEMSLMYEWWSFTEKSGCRLHCMLDHLRERYSVMGNKCMNGRLWYAACYKFVRSFDIMEKIIDDQYDLCSVCGHNTPFSICMDGCVISCDKRKLTKDLLAHEETHGDEMPQGAVGKEDCDHCFNLPDGVEETADHTGSADDRCMDHDLKLSINARSLQQTLVGKHEVVLAYDTQLPWSSTQRDVLRELSEWAMSLNKHNKNPPVTQQTMQSM